MFTTLLSKRYLQPVSQLSESGPRIKFSANLLSEVRCFLHSFHVSCERSIVSDGVPWVKFLPVHMLQCDS
jgi:hypothetical protein